MHISLIKLFQLDTSVTNKISIRYLYREKKFKGLPQSPVIFYYFKKLFLQINRAKPCLSLFWVALAVYLKKYEREYKHASGKVLPYLDHQEY